MSVDIWAQVGTIGLLPSAVLEGSASERYTDKRADRDAVILGDLPLMRQGRCSQRMRDDSKTGFGNPSGQSWARDSVTCLHMLAPGIVGNPKLLWEWCCGFFSINSSAVVPIWKSISDIHVIMTGSSGEIRRAHVWRCPPWSEPLIHLQMLITVSGGELPQRVPYIIFFNQYSSGTYHVLSAVLNSLQILTYLSL